MPPQWLSTSTLTTPKSPSPLAASLEGPSTATSAARPCCSLMRSASAATSNDYRGKVKRLSALLHTHAKPSYPQHGVTSHRLTQNARAIKRLIFRNTDIHALYSLQPETPSPMLVYTSHLVFQLLVRAVELATDSGQQLLGVRHALFSRSKLLMGLLRGGLQFSLQSSTT